MDTVTGSVDVAALHSCLNETDWFAGVEPHVPPFRSLSGFDELMRGMEPLLRILFDWEQEVLASLNDNDVAHESQQTFMSTYEMAFARARLAVPYDPFGDISHWANFAAASLSWTAGLVAVHLELDRPLLRDLETRWRCFTEGRLPCAYAVDSQELKQKFRRFRENGPPPEGYVQHFEDHPNEFIVY